jgi:hypothetical protein
LSGSKRGGAITAKKAKQAKTSENAQANKKKAPPAVKKKTTAVVRARQERGCGGGGKRSGYGKG